MKSPKKKPMKLPMKNETKPPSFTLSLFLLLYHHLNLLLLLLFLSASSSRSAQTNSKDFLRCLSLSSDDVSRSVFTPTNTSFMTILNSSIQNNRFSGPETPKPLFIITPSKPSHVQATVRCSRQHAMQIRTRSGGHDYEGLSYTSNVLPFILIDLRSLHDVSIDTEDQTAWVQSGATTGQLYYEIAKKSQTLAFPAGVYPTVGVGGLFSGGGYGTLLRKFGLAADNIIDACLVDVHGRLLNRESMGEDLFWAIRGGGGASFGIIIAWKIKLVRVPLPVTVFNVKKTLQQNGTETIHRWQYIADKLPEDLFLRMVLKRSFSKDRQGEEDGVVQATFPSLYLGRVSELMPLIEERFPELGLTEEDCTEMSWIESVIYFAGFPDGESIEVLARRRTDLRSFKGKSDYVREPMPESAIKEIWRRFEEPEAKLAKLLLTPFGGKMNEIEECDTPYPHRAGNIYEIQHLVYWKREDNDASEKYILWIEGLYDSVTPYVSKSPRAAYYNFRDLDLGRNDDGNTSYQQARIWGERYFKNNFERLVQVKTMVDPADFFRNEQSIPSLTFLSDS